MSYGSLKAVAIWTIATEDEKTMQCPAVLEPDQRKEGAAASTVEQQQHSAVQQQRSIFRELVQKLAAVSLIFQSQIYLSNFRCFSEATV